MKSINVGRFTEDDVKLSGGEQRRGDVDYRFSTTQPSERVTKECAIWSSFSFTRRGHLWLPTSKTANYLANGPLNCRAP
ncbi:MAG: hypothetical protein EOO27_36375 [Comamonadaceae bacterium]|nr:MAG: hypothetical protein EOO27_36375 [Comamonadaceae bacterium]